MIDRSTRKRTTLYVNKEIHHRARVKALQESVTMSSLFENYLTSYLAQPQLEVLEKQAIKNHIEE